MSDKKISVIMPVYNAEQYLPATLDSILAQTMGDFELICVDDGSTDASAVIIKRYASGDVRIRYHHKERTNAGDARNFGMRYADGEYLMFLDADDLFEPGLLEEMYRIITAGGADVGVCDAFLYNTEEDMMLKGDFLHREYLGEKRCFEADELLPYIFQFINPAPWNKIFRGAFLKRKKLCFQSLPRANDLYFIYNAVALADRIAVSDKRLIRYRIGNPGSLQRNNDVTPLSFLSALYALKASLISAGRYESFMESFLVLAIGITGYNLDTLRSSEAVQVLGKELDENSFEALGLNSIPVFDDWIMSKSSCRLSALVMMLRGLKSILGICYGSDNYDRIYRFYSGVREAALCDYRELMKSIPFWEKGKVVGIYGSGAHTEGLTGLYRFLFGTVRSGIVYIDTYRESGSSDGKEYVNVRDADKLPDTVIISSYPYSDVMISNLSSAGKEIEIIDYYKKYGLDLFSGMTFICDDAFYVGEV